MSTLFKSLSPYLLYIKLALAVAALIGAGLLGAKLERAGWAYQVSQLKLAQAAKDQAVLVAQRTNAERELRERAAIETTYQIKARKAADTYDQALALTKDAYRREVAAVRAAGGLRIPANVCPTGGSPAGSEAAGAGQPDVASAGTVELPERTQGRLFALAERADRLADQLRTLQAWIRDNGLYGPPAD